MSKDFLFELGLEEMPAHAVTPAINQLNEKLISFLDKYQLSYDSIDLFSTPRRLAFRINNLAEEQPDNIIEAKGPSVKVAKDSDGNWTKAAIGFTKGQGVTVDDIFLKEFNGEDYIYIKKEIKGEKTNDILPKIIDEVIKKLVFKTTMHWGNYHLEFIRPIKWLVALFGQDIVEMQILDVKSDCISRGHRFLGKDVVITDPKYYEQLLKNQYVIVDAEIRKTMIMEQIIEFATRNQWKINLNPELLEEVNNLVEFPTAFVGTFDEKYLDIPSPVLITSMKDHQRYFDVSDAKGELLPYFVSVRNGNLENLETVIEGNEKVLTARLEDAEFFYQEDKKQSIEYCVNKLNSVMFHEKIGNMTEKMNRVAIISDILANELNVDSAIKQNLHRASEIYKFDLVTNMVGEFPELQGVMGEIYALLSGENESVSSAIREHYLPTSAEGTLPITTEGAILSIADKLDSIMSFFSVDLIPNGSNDPYALRRQTYGIVRIMNHNHWNLDLNNLQHKIVDKINQQSEFKYHFDEERMNQFIKDRIDQLLQTLNIKHDIIKAVLSTNNINITQMIDSAKTLQQHSEDANYKEIIESLSRVVRLAKEDVNVEINVELFENESEHNLYQQVSQIKDYATMEELYQQLSTLSNTINQYFDQTMIMVENEAIKNNRLSQLTKLKQIILDLADVNQLIIK